jgi:Transglutaminase-like superfamily/Coenzyme PQQ synthesis protein D (PqqD)
MTGITINPSVHRVSDGQGGFILLNDKKGQWHRLNRTGALYWGGLERGEGLEAIVARLAERHPVIPRDRLRADLEAFVGELLHRDLVRLDLSDVPSLAGVSMALAPDEGATVARGQQLAASFAVPIALILLRLPFRVTVRAVVALKKALAKQPATADDVRAAMVAGQRLARCYPGRFACLEESLTAVIALALLRRRAEWCLGTAADPRRFHAWIEVDGRIIDRIVDNRLSAERAYQRLFSV